MGVTLGAIGECGGKSSVRGTGDGESSGKMCGEAEGGRVDGVEVLVITGRRLLIELTGEVHPLSHASWCKSPHSHSIFDFVTVKFHPGRLHTNRSRGGGDGKPGMCAMF